MKTAHNEWYATTTAADQGLVIDERTGRNVAVTYDKADAPLVAAAPRMLAVLEEACGFIADRSDEPDEGERAMLAELYAVIASVKSGQ